MILDEHIRTLLAGMLDLFASEACGTRENCELCEAAKVVKAASDNDEARWL